MICVTPFCTLIAPEMVVRVAILRRSEAACELRRTASK